jgi:BirA family biotin operon repressor/biotin-[acetyl-CoA-carboxylase] ligase
VKLSAKAQEAGVTLGVFDVLGSTNDEAFVALDEGVGAAHWVVAREQKAGRGRHGRAWSSPPGNLYASLALLNPCAPQKGAQLGFVAGLALHQALSDVTGLGVERLAIKWPNDIVLDRAKLAGLLVEGRMMALGVSAAVIGMGVNCLSHPDHTPYAATDLKQIGLSVTPDQLFERLSERMFEALALWQSGDHFGRVRALWLERVAGLGQRIQVRTGESAREGIFRDIDADGCLVLDGPQGQETIMAGDVFFLPPESKGLSA